MGYTAKPVRQRVVFHPWLRALTNGFTYKAITKLHQLKPSNHYFSKAEGLLRFYQQGKRGLDYQCWPECLADTKKRLLGDHSTSPKDGILEDK
jgi:hypothetical protein